jgi:tetratricopeptide (TPR) repeat protein
MSVNPKLFLFILPLFIFISFCSSSQGERERGIRFASSGQWDKAIELLEKYVKSNIQVISNVSFENISGISDEKKPQIRDFLEALLYLLGSYLGKAGFDERKIIDYVIQMKDVDPNEEGSEKELSKIVIQMFDFLKLDYPQALSTIYKAQRLYESIMYGKEKFLDSDEGNSQLENLGEFQTDPSKDKVLHEIKRLINSIEFLGGKILIWKVVLESKMLGHPDYYAKPKSERPPTSPSLCLILDENDPFLKKYEDVKSMDQGMITGITLLSYGSSEELFKQQGENYSDIIINRLLKDFQKSISPTCDKYSKNFYNQFSKAITQAFQDQLTQAFQEKLTGFQDKITGITVSPESITPNPDPVTGVYICPRRNFDKYFKDFFMCGFKEYVQEMAKEIAKDIQFFPQNATSQIVFREPDGNKDCEGNEIKDSNRLLTLQFFFSDKVTSGEAQIIRNEICSENEFKNLFKRFEKLVDNLKKPLSEFEKDITNTFPNFPDPITLPEKYLKEILERREDPKVWKDIK